MSDSKKPSIADFIATTLGAQTREHAIESIKARRAQLLNSTAPPLEAFVVPEPMPIIDAPNDFAKAFFNRLLEKDQNSLASKPRLIVDNDKSGRRGDENNT